MPLPLTTERLTIRPFAEGDLDALHAIFGDRDAMRYVEADLGTREATRDALRRYAADHAREGLAFWAVLERATGELVGDCGFVRRGGELEMGWTFGRRWWGRGYATEAGRACLEEARALGHRRIVAMIRPENTASIRLAERLGFARDGTRTLNGREQHPYVAGG